MGTSDPADTQAKTGGFVPALEPVLEPAFTEVANQLTAIAGLGVEERRAVQDGFSPALTAVVLHLVSRLLVLELNAARVTGKLRAADAAGRWTEFLHLAGDESFWRSYLPSHYPTLMPRLDRVVRARCTAAVTVARRFAADRDDLAPLLDGAPHELTAFTMGLGDSHSGQTVDLLRCGDDAVVYKPRALDTDLALSALLAGVRRGAPWVRIEVPAVVDRGRYGWARQVHHRHAADDGELRLFYRGIGHWLGVMRLLGGTDIHSENLVACGPTPVVVDCETIFTPYPPPAAPGLGAATDRAMELVSAVLRTRLLPARRGNGRQEDPSAAGNLPDEQPAGLAPAILGSGLDTARLGSRPSRVRRALNHPGAAPALRRFWPDLLDGFDQMTDRLVDLDRAGDLEGLLDAFRDCRIRVVARSTARYADLSWMLWHPVSLHDESAAVRQAAELMAAEPDTPHDPAVIAAEITELLVGDVPVFTTTPGRGRLDGPGGARWGTTADLVADVLQRWRSADRRQEREVARASVASAYLDTRWRPGKRLPVAKVRHGDEEPRRRALAASLMRQVRDTAVRGPDGTATWIAPVLGIGGWYVHPSGLDLYGGAPGIAVALAGYLHEVRHGRADPVAGLPELLAETLRTVRLREDREPGGPRLPGAYLGAAGRIWSWLTLAGLGHDEGLARAAALAELLTDPGRARGSFTGSAEVFTGCAGAVVPLLQLAEATGQRRWARQAIELGQRLTVALDTSPSFAHGVTGVGWALGRLAESTGDASAAERAAAAFDHEERSYEGSVTGWCSGAVEPVAAWCVGTVGIGLAAADLLWRNRNPRHRHTLRRAAANSLVAGLGWNHTLCHGDLGTWELLDAALRHDVAPPGLDRATLDAGILSGLERHGPVLTHDVAAPGMLIGCGGIAYQLLRMHPDCDLPSVLLLDGRVPG